MEGLFLTLFNISITASFVVLAVIFVRFLTQKAPKWIICLLWGIVGLRLVMPFSIESVISLIPSKETIPQSIMITDTPQINSGISALNSYVNPILSESLKPDVTASANPVQIIIFIASIVWVTGVAAMLIYSLVSFILLKKKVAASISIKENIYYCDSIESPFILGIINPKIYLPSDLECPTYEYVIAHEKAHLKRLDHLWKPLAFLILSVYWFNPFLWLAFILFCQDIESACDQRVIKNMNNQDIKGYSAALLSCSTNRKAVSACPLAFGETGVKKRIKGVLSYKKPAFWIIVITLFAGIVVSVCFLTNPKDKISYPTPVNTTESSYLQPYELAYNNGSFSYIASTADMPTYLLTKDLELSIIDGNNLITTLGKMEEITLNEENFDTRLTQEYWITKFSISGFRNDNKRAWQLYVDDGKDRFSDLYMLFEQANGNYYLGVGYYNAQSVEPTNSDDSFLRWIYRVTYSNTQEITENVTANIDGRVFYYKEPTYEHATPEIVRYNDFKEKDLKEFLKKAKALNWFDDALTDRISFNFDGYVYYGGYKIFFGYENNCLYCNEYFADANEDIFSYIKSLRKTAKKNIKTVSEVYTYLYQNDSYSVMPTLKLDFTNNSFTFTWSPLSSYLAIGRFEIEDNILICKTADGKNTYTFSKVGENFVFDAKKSSAIGIYKTDSEPEKIISNVPDGAVFKIREINKTNGVTNSVTIYD